MPQGTRGTSAVDEFRDDVRALRAAGQADDGVFVNLELGHQLHAELQGQGWVAQGLERFLEDLAHGGVYIDGVRLKPDWL